MNRYTCDECGYDRSDSKLLTWSFEYELEGGGLETGQYTHCDRCYFALFPDADPLTFEELPND